MVSVHVYIGCDAPAGVSNATVTTATKKKRHVADDAAGVLGSCSTFNSSSGHACAMILKIWTDVAKILSGMLCRFWFCFVSVSLFVYRNLN